MAISASRVGICKSYPNSSFQMLFSSISWFQKKFLGPCLNICHYKNEELHICESLTSNKYSQNSFCTDNIFHFLLRKYFYDQMHRCGCGLSTYEWNEIMHLEQRLDNNQHILWSTNFLHCILPIHLYEIPPTPILPVHISNLSSCHGNHLRKILITLTDKLTQRTFRWQLRKKTLHV